MVVELFCDLHPYAHVQWLHEWLFLVGICPALHQHGMALIKAA